MLFAGGMVGRKCPDCGADYTLIASASVLFYILLIGFGSAYIVDPVKTLVGTTIGAIIASHQVITRDNVCSGSWEGRAVATWFGVISLPHRQVCFRA